MSRYVESAVILSGWPAYAINNMLRRHWRDVEDLPPHLRAPLEDTREAIEHAAQRYARECRRGNAEAARAETEAPSDKDTLTSEEVADALGVSDRRVRQLAGTGELPGRQVAGKWTFDPGAVVALSRKRGTR